MKRLIAGGIVLLLCLVAGAWWWKQHSANKPAADASGADATQAAPVAQVRSELPRVQRLDETLQAVGDVTVGQASGLGFARAGQVTRLAVVVGDRVAKGAVLATLVPDPAVRQAYAQAVDAAALARREWDRAKELLVLRLATQSQVDTAEKAWHDAVGAVRAQDEQGGGTGESSLVAPFDGVVTTVTALQGDRVQAGAPVLQVASAAAMRVLIGIEPSDRARVHAGTRVTLWPVMGPAGSVPGFDLPVAEVQNTVDPKTQLIDVVVLLPRGLANPLAPGMKVRARLRVGSLSSVAVARNAVLTDERGDYVFQLSGGKAHRVKITRTLDDGTLVAIAGLVDMRLPVVVEGNYELQDGMAVREAAP